ncbi:MAG TPA: polysaccharide deacetylase family protein [Anaerolineales bacterium]|jgi:peptidoglycan/xylan/chitin deacetylase (PgdA/CDA1 family)
MDRMSFFIVLLLLAACQPLTPVPTLATARRAPTRTPLLPAGSTPGLPPSATAYPTRTPADILALASPLTPTITHTATNTPTPTLLSGHAPVLPPIKRTFITNGSRDKPLVALTFDMCQKPELPSWFDKKIYQALVDSNTRATFFLGGDWMRTHIPETRLLAGNSLFELGNHSYTHPDLPDLNSDQISREVLKTQDMLYHLTGRQPRIFRLPSGKYNDLVLDTIALRGLYTIQWDADTADPVPGNDAENILRLVQERVHNGSIVLMHANGRGWHTGEALPAIITYLRAQGYCLVTVPQLIGLDPVPSDCSQ